jgi:PPM family protein phosphatase
MVIKFKSLKVQTHGRSEVGLVRDNNEDAWLVEPQSNIYVLCDGMGGHIAGEVAAQEAVACFANLVKTSLSHVAADDPRTSQLIFKKLIQEVNAVIYRLSQKDRDLRGMGTTLCCVYFQKSSMIVGHVGDSRVYLHRKGELKKLTEDHSLVSELLELGELTSRQAREYAYRNIITRAIGAEPEVEPAVQNCELVPGDRVLMCSDGLSDLLAPLEIERILNMDKPLEATIDHLVNKAIRKGGHDNITAILMQLESSHE